MTRKRRSTEERFSRKFKGCLAFILLILLLVISPVLFFLWWTKKTAPVDYFSKEKKMFVILRGWGVDQIAQRLKQEGLIKNPLAFKLMAIKEGIAKDLQAGDFRLSSSMSTFEIAQSLTHGSLDIWITIPEGLRREEIAEVISAAFAKQNGVFDKQEFLKRTANLEGFLFPDTYLINKEASVEEIIDTFQKNFNQKVSSFTKDTTLTLNQLVNLASILERETKYKKDRPIVAGILIKRLKKGWPLQVDASVQYAKANQQFNSLTIEQFDNFNWWPKVAPGDLEINSSYNTNKNIGLPPTPICNPGLESFKAAANPEESKYWFYLSDFSGNIHYAATDKEHEANVEKYLRTSH